MFKYACRHGVLAITAYLGRDLPVKLQKTDGAWDFRHRTKPEWKAPMEKGLYA
jgi:hypothetical protein